MGKKIVKIAALAIIAVVAFYMARWFGFKAVVGILLCEAAFALYVGVSRAEEDAQLIEAVFESICKQIEQQINEGRAPDNQVKVTYLKQGEEE